MARITNSCVVALDGNGNLIVADCGNHCSAVIITLTTSTVRLRPFVETVRCKRALVLNGKLFADRSEAAEWLRTVGEEFRTKYKDAFTTNGVDDHPSLTLTLTLTLTLALLAKAK